MSWPCIRNPGKAIDLGLLELVCLDFIYTLDQQKARFFHDETM